MAYLALEFHKGSGAGGSGGPGGMEGRGVIQSKDGSVGSWRALRLQGLRRGLGPLE